MCTPGECGAGNLCGDSSDPGSGCESTRGCITCHFGGLGGAPVAPATDPATGTWFGSEGYSCGFVIKRPEPDCKLHIGDVILKISTTGGEDGSEWINVEGDVILQTRDMPVLYVDVWRPHSDKRWVEQLR